MATLYAKTAGGDWATAATWSNVSSAGVDSSGPPASTDDVVFDGLSGNVTIGTTASCRDITCTGYTGTLSHTAGTNISISGSMLLVAGMTYTRGGSNTTMQFLATATGKTITSAGKTVGAVTFNGVGGGWTLQDSLTATGAVWTLTAGNLDTNGQAVNADSFASTNTNTRVLTLGTSAVTITGGNTTIWNITTATNMTLSAASSTITFSGSSPTFTGNAALTYGTVVFTGASSTSINATTIGNLTKTGTAAKTDALILGGTVTVTGTLTVNGNSAINRIGIRSSSNGTARTLSAAVVSMSNVDIRDITAAGAGSWNLAAITGNSGDSQGNTGITFTTAASQTWSGTSGGNWSTNAWTTRVPLPQDDVVINAAFSASQTITADMPRLGKSINWTGATGTPTWAFSSTTNDIFGSVTLIAAMTISGTQGLTLRGRSTFTITSAGKQFTQAITLDAPSGTYTLNDAFSLDGLFTITAGAFNSNNFNVTYVRFTASGNITRSITMGTSVWTSTTAGALTVWNTATTTNLTFSGASATIVVSVATTSTRTFDGGGLTFGTLTYTVAGSTGTLLMVGANTFNTINYSDATNARTLTLTISMTTTVTNFNVVGASGRKITINSSTGGTPATLSKASGTVSSDYLTIQDSTATGGAAWYAGANSDNVSGNTGWIFTATPGRVFGDQQMAY